MFYIKQTLYIFNFINEKIQRFIFCLTMLSVYCIILAVRRDIKYRYPKERDNGEKTSTIWRKISSSKGPKGDRSMLNLIDTISSSLAEMRLILEGAISIYEKLPDFNSDEYSLIGDALYLMREKVMECLTACQNDSDGN